MNKKIIGLSLLACSFVLQACQEPEGSTEINKVEIDKKDEDGWTQIHRLVSCGEIDMALDLLEKNEATPLQIAAYHGETEKVLELLKRGANPNEKNFFRGWTPLHYSAFNGNMPTIRVLLENGVDPMIKNNSGRVPQDYIGLKQWAGV